MFSGLSFILLAAGGSSYNRTGDTCAAVTGCLTIIVNAEPEVIFIGVDNQRTAPEVTGVHTLQHITIRPIREFNISEITCMAFYCPCTVRPMIRLLPHVPVRTGACASFTTEIACDMNMESMFARW